jgi:hypothetical protein
VCTQLQEGKYLTFSDLFKPKWKHSDRIVRLQAVERLDDQAALAFVCQNDVDQLVRMAAVKRVTDPNVWVRLASYDEDLQVRMTAVMQLTDQILLAEVAKRSLHQEVRLSALYRLTDERLLADVALFGPAAVQEPALERVDNRRLLLDVASYGSHEARQTALQRLGNDAILDLAVRNRDPGVRSRMAEVLCRSADKWPCDSAVAASIACDAPDKEIRAMVISRLVFSIPAVVLAQIAEEDRDAEVRARAASALAQRERQDKETERARRAAERGRDPSYGRCSECGRMDILRSEYRYASDYSGEEIVQTIDPICGHCFVEGGYWKR